MLKLILWAAFAAWFFCCLELEIAANALQPKYLQIHISTCLPKNFWLRDVGACSFGICVDGMSNNKCCSDSQYNSKNSSSNIIEVAMLYLITHSRSINARIFVVYKQHDLRSHPIIWICITTEINIDTTITLALRFRYHISSLIFRIVIIVAFCLLSWVVVVVICKVAYLVTVRVTHCTDALTSGYLGAK